MGDSFGRIQPKTIHAAARIAIGREPALGDGQDVLARAMGDAELPDPFSMPASAPLSLSQA